MAYCRFATRSAWADVRHTQLGFCCTNEIPTLLRIAIASHTQQNTCARNCIGLLSNCRCDVRLGHRGSSGILPDLVAALGLHLVSRRDRNVYRHSRQTSLRSYHQRDARVYGDARWLALSRGLFAVIGVSAALNRPPTTTSVNRIAARKNCRRWAFCLVMLRPSDGSIGLCCWDLFLRPAETHGGSYERAGDKYAGRSQQSIIAANSEQDTQDANSKHKAD